MNTNEWKVVGRFVALLVSLYSIVTECFKGAKVSLEILDWLSKEGKEKLQEAVKGLIVEYKESLRPVVEIFLTLVKKVKVSSVIGKKTSACFTDKKLYYDRDDDLDCWLPEDQEAEGGGDFSVLKLKKQSCFKEFLDFQIGRGTVDIAELSRELKGRGYTTTLTRIESLINKQENGEDVGLLTNGHANFFLVLDKERNVCVVNVFRYDNRWGVSVYHLDVVRGWGSGRHLFLRN